MIECYGFPAKEIARRCGVDVTTARRWKKGTYLMPEAARMIMSGDLGYLDSAWRGWTLLRGQLTSPEGWVMSVGDLLSIPLMRAQMSAYQAKERQVPAMDEQPLPGTLPAILA